MGNLKFKENPQNKNSTAVLENPEVLEIVAHLFGVEKNLFLKALTSRTVTTGASKRGDSIEIPLDVSQCLHTRDALGILSIYRT